MCSFDNCDEIVNVLTDRLVRAKKPHECGECYREIGTGETYRYTAGTFDGDFVIYKMCAGCDQAKEWLLNNCNGFLYHGIYEDIREHVDYSYRAARIAVGMQRKWRAFKGEGLMKSVPAATQESIKEFA